MDASKSRSTFHARAAVLAALPAIAVACVLLIPFLDKAFTIDDPLFLMQARQAALDPLHPTAVTVVWSDRPQRMSEIMPSGPVMAWLLIPCVALGGAEWAAHAAQLVLFALAIVATVSLAFRLGCEAAAARAAGLLLATTPAALAMAGTAMPDVPAMAFGVAGLERLLAWRDGRRAHQAVMAVAFLSLAALSRSHHLLLLGVGLLLVARVGRARHDRPGWVVGVPLFVPPVIVAAVLFAVADPEAPSSGIAAAAGRFSVAGLVPENLAALAVHFALVLPLGIPWALVHPRRVFLRPAFYVAAAAGYVAISLSGAPANAGIAAVAAGLGAAAVWDVLATGLLRRDRAGIALGAWLLVPSAVAVYIHLPSKYALVSAPAAAIVVARAFGPLSSRGSRALLGATLVAGAALGVAILRADATFGELGRRAAAELIAPEVAAGRTVWFAGHWGFQWYAEDAGARPVTALPPYPAKGDVVVASEHSGGELAAHAGRVRVIRRLVDDRPGGRIMSRKLGAGFYSNYWGFLPWAWGRSPADRYEIAVVDEPPR